MQCIVPFAAPGSEAGRAALAGLALPSLRALMALLGPPEHDDGDEFSLSPPHERSLARALGWQGGDGRLPWAARQAAADGLDVGDLAWGLVTPAHWHLGTEQISMTDPAGLLLDADTSRALCDAVRELFVAEGFVLHWAAPLRWYAAHERLADLPTAALDRVIGRNVDAWLGSDPALRRIRRLQAEVQMLLYTHPLNAEREARGLLPVNSFWLSGCGVHQREAATDTVVDDRLRQPALAEDWPGWCKAWDSLDAGPLAQMLARARQGQHLRLTLCGEHAGVTLGQRPPGAWARRWADARLRWLPGTVPPPQALLNTL
jgi:hypothetical protein